MAKCTDSSLIADENYLLISLFPGRPKLKFFIKTTKLALKNSEAIGKMLKIKVRFAYWCN